MKKKNVNKLSLNKKAISRLDANTPKGGQAGPQPTPPVKLTVDPNQCATQNNECPSSVVYWCNISCYIC
jgi:hypothetical protein